SGASYFGILARGLPSNGPVTRRSLLAGTSAEDEQVLSLVADRVDEGKERTFLHSPKAGGKRLGLALDRTLTRWRDKAGAPVFELLARTLANERAGPGLAQGLSGTKERLPVVLLDSSRHLVEIEPRGRLLGVNRAALEASRLSPSACLVAVGIAHGLRAVARIRAGESYDAEKEWQRDLQNFLLLLVGIQGTEWEVSAVVAEVRGFLDPRDPVAEHLPHYAEKLHGSLARRTTSRLDDRVFRDGALFDRLPGREKLKVVLAGTLAWYGVLTLGLLRLPRRWFARWNPYYETSWWIFRAKPGGRRLVKTALLSRGLRRLRSLRILSAAEYLWASWNPILAETCLRPVYRSAGGNRRPFLATMATFAYTALVIHPLWITLLITGTAWALGHVWPWIHEETRIASRENLILHGIVIGFWVGIGLIVATSKLFRRLLSRETLLLP
ncbi:MAG: hypothetical protein ACYS99_22610, partial [Planctomycetota bacterium]